MGLFLNVISILDSSEEAVANAVRVFAGANEGIFELQQAASEEYDPNCGLMASGNGNVSMLMPEHFMGAKELSKSVSATLNKPVFSFHIHDGDLWMFRLFVNGEEVARFNPWLEQWQEIHNDDQDSWLVDAETVCQHVPGLKPEFIRNYLVEWTEDLLDLRSKAYPDDEYAYGDDWQMVDFMRRLGFVYPRPSDGEPLGRGYRLRAPAFSI